MEEMRRDIWEHVDKDVPSADQITTRIARAVCSFSSYVQDLTFCSLSVGASGDPLIYLDNVDRSLDGGESYERYQELLATDSVKRKMVRFTENEIQEIPVDRVPGWRTVVHAVGNGLYLIREL
jgi:hypothetical protein